jgi:hypothetical protein
MHNARYILDSVRSINFLASPELSGIIHNPAIKMAIKIAAKIIAAAASFL